MPGRARPTGSFQWHIQAIKGELTDLRAEDAGEADDRWYLTLIQREMKVRDAVAGGAARGWPTQV